MKQSRTCFSTRAVRQCRGYRGFIHVRKRSPIFAGHVLVHEKVLVAELHELVVGFKAREGDHVDHLYIAPSFQGRGIGDKLLAMAKELRPSSLTLWRFQRKRTGKAFLRSARCRGFGVH